MGNIFVFKLLFQKEVKPILNIEIVYAVIRVAKNVKNQTETIKQ